MHRYAIRWATMCLLGFHEKVRLTRRTSYIVVYVIVCVWSHYSVLRKYADKPIQISTKHIAIVW